MQEEEIDILCKHKDQLVRKFAEHYREAFFNSPVKKIHVAQLQIINLATEDAGKLGNLKKMVNLGDDPTEEERESVSLTLFGNKEVFDQAMKFLEKVPIMIAGVKAGEIACDINAHTETAPVKRSRVRMPDGIPRK